ncbi:MAG: OmpH family outer membrane protein, partial [Myxococcota bacterium]
VTETAEGKAAQKRLDSMYSSKRGELERMQSDLQKKATDLQSRQSILSPDALQKEQQELYVKQAEFEQTYMRFQDEFQKTYSAMLGELDTKMRAIAGKTAQSKSCSILLDKAAVVYAGSDVADVSSSLVDRFNREHPGK